jgi:hypothetical protein
MTPGYVNVVWDVIENFQQVDGGCFFGMDDFFTTDYTFGLLKYVFYYFVVGVFLTSHEMDQSHGSACSSTQFCTTLDKFSFRIIHGGNIYCSISSNLVDL